MRIGKSRLCGNMAIGTVSDSLQAREILESICAHNASGEIHYGETQDNLKTAKIRFLSLEGEVICTDKPQSIGEQVDLVSGQVILVYFTHDNARWAFHSRVQKATRLVRLNANQRVVGMSIAVPHEIQLQQRRRDYRVMTVSHGIGGEIVIESEDVEFACPVERSAFSGVIHNVSVRGLGFLVDGLVGRHFKRGRYVYTGFTLPGSEQKWIVRAQIRHVQELPARERTMLGLQIAERPGLDPQRLRDKIHEFTIAEQRRKLRRRR